MKKFLVLIFSVFLLNFIGCSNTDSSNLKSNEPKVQYMTEADKQFFREIIKNNKLYNKKTISSVIKKLSNKDISKSEFERNNEYINRYNAEVKKIYGSEYFPINIKSESIAYDIEKKELSIKVPSYYIYSIMSNKKIDSYIGENSFGVTKVVNVLDRKEADLNFTASSVNVDEYGYIKDDIRIPMNIEEAKKIDKSKINVVSIIKPFLSDLSSKIMIAGKDEFYVAPTIDKPEKIYVTKYSLSSLVVYTQVTYNGEIIYEIQPIKIFDDFYFMSDVTKNKLVNGLNALSIFPFEYYLIDTKGNVVDFIKDR